MKTKIILSLVCTLFAAQAVSQSWSVTGNSGTTTSHFLGTTDSKDLRFRTGNSTRMTISSSGYVGIGTTPESASRVNTYFSVPSIVAQDQFYSAMRSRIYGSSATQANGYLGVYINSAASISNLPLALKYMGVCGIKEDGSGFGTGVLGWNKGNNAGGIHYGVYGLANGNATGASATTDRNIGILGRATGNYRNIGVYGDADGTSDWAGYFKGRGYFSDKVGIGVESPSSMLTVDAPVSVSPFRLMINGSSKLLMNSSGKLGIGTTTPTARLHVKTTSDVNCVAFSNYQSTTAPINGLDVLSQNLGGASFGVNAKSNGTGENYAVVGKSIVGGTLNYGVFGEASIGNSGSAYGVYGKATGGSSNTPVYGVYGTSAGASNHWAGYFNGTTYTSTLRVGTTNSASGYIVSVGGKVMCEEVRVALEGNWPDYVFSEGYDLLPLEDLKDHLKTKKHLPGIPSANEVESQGGYDVGNMQQKLLEKVEELTLYIIKLNDENKEMRTQIEALKN